VAIGPVLFGLALTVLAGMLVADPFLRRGIFNRRGRSPSPMERRRSTLLAVRDLDFDFQTGKVLEEDYQAWRARLLEQAARTLADEERAESELAEGLEAEVAEIRKAGSGARFCPSCGRPRVSGERFCSACGAAIVEGCARCGAVVRPGDRFCTECGQPSAQAGGGPG